MPHAQAFLAQAAVPAHENVEQGGHFLANVWRGDGKLLVRRLDRTPEKSSLATEQLPHAEAEMLYGR